jgi:hypothetical protein
MRKKRKLVFRDRLRLVRIWLKAQMTLGATAFAIGSGAAFGLLWPTDLTPGALRHVGSATSFLQTLWQVDATALAL